MQYFLIFLLMLAGLILVTWPLTVLFHELGHAIPALLLTRQNVTIYIGSHGDPKKSISFRIGRLVVFFKYNMFMWRQGLCVPSAEKITINRQIVYTITGPLSSITVAIVALYCTFGYDMHGFLKLFFIVFLVFAFFDFLLNIIPNPIPVVLFDGRVCYNDGYSLKRLFNLRQFKEDYEKAAELYNGQQFEEAATLCNEMLNKGLKDDQIYRFTLSAHIRARQYEKAIEVAQPFLLLPYLLVDDLINIAFCFTQSGDQCKAMELYDKILEVDAGNKLALNNKAYSLTVLNRFQEAIPLLDSAIEADNDFAFAYNNRGLCGIKTGDADKGLADIKHSLQLDPENSYAYRNLGMYHLDRGEYAEALNLFARAKEMDRSTHMIDELIKEASIQKP